MDRKITLELLRRLRACSPGLEFFEAHYPDGCCAEELIADLRKSDELDRYDWIAWLARSLPAGYFASDSVEVRLGLCVTYEARSALARRMPAGVPGDSAEFRAKLMAETEKE